MRIARLLPLTLVATLVVGDISAQTETPANAIANAAGQAAPPNSVVSAIVMEVASGRVLYEQNADAALNPASNTKLITAAVALARLGASRRFTTTLNLQTPGTTASGPLYFHGGGDPSLSTADLLAMARDVVTLGIRRISGGIVVDDTALGSEHLPPAFEQQPGEASPFRAAVSGASVDENSLAIRVRPGASAGAPAIVLGEPAGYIDVENDVITTDNGVPDVRLEYSMLSDGRERVHATGRFPSTVLGRTWHRRVENPSLATGFAIRAAFGALGVAVDGSVEVGTMPRGTLVVAEHTSAPLSTLLFELGKSSNNFYAESILLQLAADDPAAPASFARATQLEISWLTSHGVSPAGLQLINGSGLFDANRVSARQLAQVLHAAWTDASIRDEFVAQLSTAGDDGTLRNRLRLPAAAHRIRAKTGTLDDVVALSGYIVGDNPAQTIAFSIVTNHVQGHLSAAREFCDRIVTETARTRQWIESD